MDQKSARERKTGLQNYDIRQKASSNPLFNEEQHSLKMTFLNKDSNQHEINSQASVTFLR